MASNPPKGDKKSSTESLLQRLQKAVTQHNVLPFLDNSDLSRVSQAARFARTSPYQSTLKERELLSYVFKADPKQAAEFFTRPCADLKTILKKVSYREGYFSNKSKTFVCFRNWKAVSPLQVAYLCGDGPFLGRRLLALLLDNTLPKDDKEKFLAEAKQQLSEIIPRIPVDTNTADINANATAAAPAVSSNATADSKEIADGKAKVKINSGSAATTDEFADSLEFLGALKKLISAYNDYVSQYNSLTKPSRWSEIDTLWGEVCECQKRMYHYLRLEYFGPIPFCPVPAFDQEPPRGPCRYFNKHALDLDEIGLDISVGFYKGSADAVMLLRAEGRLGSALAPASVRRLDLAAISHLYKLRVDDLRNTISQLHSLEAALTFINDVKPKPRIDF